MSLRREATHESAHVALAVHHAARVYSVEVFTDNPDMGGLCLADERRLTLTQNLEYTVAGIAAEVALLGMDLEDAIEGNSRTERSDVAVLRRLLGDANPMRSARVQSAMRAATIVVKKERIGIERLARRLERLGFVSGDDAEEIFELMIMCRPEKKTAGRRVAGSAR